MSVIGGAAKGMSSPFRGESPLISDGWLRFGRRLGDPAKNFAPQGPLRNAGLGAWLCGLEGAEGVAEDIGDFADGSASANRTRCKKGLHGE